MKKPDDFIAVCGDYILRAERMQSRIWWWCVYHKEDRIADSSYEDSMHGRTESEAKVYAETKYFKHAGIDLHQINWITTAEYAVQKFLES